MDCPVCGTELVAFAVPEAHREDVPAAATGLCPSCLTLLAVDEGPAPADAPFERIIEGFPQGEAGATTALAVGLLVDSLALNREAVRRLFEAASDDGVDPWLVLERLDAAGSVQPDADLGRLRRQLEQLWR